MNIKIIIGVSAPSLRHAGKPVAGHAHQNTVATAQEAAAYLTAFVGQYPKALKPAGSYTTAQVLAALSGKNALADFTLTYPSGTKCRKVSVCFSEAKVSPAPIAAF